jgi:hypothetical protein
MSRPHWLTFTRRDALVVFATLFALQFGNWVSGETGRQQSAEFWVQQMQRMREEVDPKQGWRRAQSQTLRDILGAVSGPDAVARFDERMRLLGQPPIPDEP